MKALKQQKVMILSVLFFLLSCFIGYLIIVEPHGSSIDNDAEEREMVSDTNELTHTDIELSEDDYTRLRESVPYVPIDPYSSYLLGYPIVSDETGKQLAHFIQKVTFITFPKQSFKSIDDKNAGDFIRISSVYATKVFTWVPDYADDPVYQPQLEPFSDIAEGSMFIYMKEHVELTAKVLLGEKAEIVHGEGSVRYDEASGIYWPAFMGMEKGSHTVILSYEEDDDQYTADVVFPEYSGDQYLFFEYADDATMADFVEYCHSLPVHRITLKKGKNDTLTYYAHILPSKDTDVDESKADSIVREDTVYYSNYQENQENSDFNRIIQSNPIFHCTVIDALRSSTAIN